MNAKWSASTCFKLLMLFSWVAFDCNLSYATGKDDFLNKQFWIGFKGSAFLTKAIPVQRYSVYNLTTNAPASIYDKQYKSFTPLTVGGGLELTFCYKAFAISFQPDFRRTTFIYTNTYTWLDPQNSNNSYKAAYNSEQKLDYFVYPLLLRYDPLKTKLKISIEAGAYYAYLNNALKTTTVTITDYASGGVKPYVAQEVTTGARSLFIKSNIGWLAGMAISYPIGNVRISASAAYWHNTNNITNIANRYDNDRLTGSGDVLDDVRLRNISFSLSCLIPLRFLQRSNLTAE